MSWPDATANSCSAAEVTTFENHSGDGAPAVKDACLLCAIGVFGGGEPDDTTGPLASALCGPAAATVTISSTVTYAVSLPDSESLVRLAQGSPRGSSVGRAHCNLKFTGLTQNLGQLKALI